MEDEDKGRKEGTREGGKKGEKGKREGGLPKPELQNEKLYCWVYHGHGHVLQK